MVTILMLMSSTPSIRSPLKQNSGSGMSALFSSVNTEQKKSFSASAFYSVKFNCPFSLTRDPL